MQRRIRAKTEVYQSFQEDLSSRKRRKRKVDKSACPAVEREGRAEQDNDDVKQFSLSATMALHALAHKSTMVKKMNPSPNPTVSR
jgi:hypothetical protein